MLRHDFMLLCHVERRKRSHLRRQANHANQVPEQNDASGSQRRETDGPVLPQLTPHRPVEGPRRRLYYWRDFSRFKRRLVHGIRWSIRSIHLAAPLGAAEALVTSFPSTATNRSAMLGVCTSPNAASCWRLTLSKSSTLRPSAWRS